MPHAIWSGAINFGLVSIPVQLYTAVRSNDLRFHFLHGADQGRLSSVRVCNTCGKRVEWENVVRGYECEKDRYVVLSDEDFKRVDVQATGSIDIVEFVEASEIDPMFYETPYYLAPDKKGRHAYALLRDVLAKRTMIGVARVVIRTREHLAAVRPRGGALMLELMHFADELVDPSGLDLPTKTEHASAGELKSATMLVDAITATFDPASLKDTYREALMTLIEARAQGKHPKGRGGKARAPTNVIDLQDALKRSVVAARKQRRKPARREPAA